MFFNPWIKPTFLDGVFFNSGCVLEALLWLMYFVFLIVLAASSAKLILSELQTKHPCALIGLFPPFLINISPLPKSFSAPISSNIIRDSIELEVLRAIRQGILALIRPVTTSTLGD